MVADLCPHFCIVAAFRFEDDPLRVPLDDVDQYPARFKKTDVALGRDTLAWLKLGLLRGEQTGLGEEEVEHTFVSHNVQT